MNDFRMKSLLRMAYAMASAAFAPMCAVHAQERVETRMFELTYASAEEVAENFNRTWRGQMATNGIPLVVGDMAVPFKEPGDRSKAVEGVMLLDLRDLEDRAKETSSVE